MKKKIQFILLLTSMISYSQIDQVIFEYDGKGNQALRMLCINCSPNSSKSVNVKEISSLQNDDLLKFYKDDEISYYPNPVKEELYLNWKLIDEKFVTSVQVVGMRGDILNSYDNPNKTNNQNLSFQHYPSGVYIVLLKYNDGESKKIKIIKQ